MQLHITELASNRLTKHLNNQAGVFKIFYDTEGCGCNGVIVILIVDEPDALDVVIESNLSPFYVDAKQQFNLEQQMKLDAEPNYPSFKLSSDSGVFSSNVRVRDIRSATVGGSAVTNACSL
ncbi:iron-sulfur cluster biosynthesis family protein [Paenibacillus sp. CAU 1782]